MVANDAKIMPTWLYRQDLAKFSLNRHYNKLILQVKHAKIPASAGSRTRVNCLEGSYANRYTTDAREECVLTST
ncbi:hypothetical protein TNCV_4885931 [Trichonephila clavipes]|uniref:Uncharacterized protein n=1 Tax=Trichonephila clavipes TaxID=2585209 RepID=A0A8X6RV79_TRICX|nr:hypothetical protein TNCV_4885931 [Trichonephila clavipes]